MRRLAVAAGLLAPAAVLLFFTLRPEADATVRDSLGHFYVVTFTTFAAAVISLLLVTALGAAAEARHLLAAAAFVVMGALFASHGAATPGAIIAGFHPAVTWSAWLTLAGGGLLFALAGLQRPGPPVRPRALRAIIAASAGAVLLYLAIAVLAPGLLDAIDSQAAPAHRYAIFAVTVVLWLAAAAGFARSWRATRSPVDASLAFVAFWLAQAGASLHLFEVWQLSWWLYHALLLIGFLVTAGVLLREYERARQFRLVHYYLAIATVVTALLALTASHLYAESTYRQALGDLETTTRALAAELSASVARQLPADATASQVYARYGASLDGLPLGELALFSTGGFQVYPSGEDDYTVESVGGPAFAAALAGEPQVRVFAPDDAPPGYAPAGSAHVVQTLVAFRGATGAPGGVAIFTRAAPELDRAILAARQTGLVLSALTMGLLFAALLTVVLRADRLIGARNAELAAAYHDLRAAEAMRDDLTHMVVHDLRNPLTAIAASLDLMGHAAAANRPDLRAQFVANARGAVTRMTELLEDILAVGKIEVGELSPQLSRVALEPLLAERLRSFRPQAEVQHKRLELVCTPQLVARLDPALIGRVVDNLVGNALKYTGDGGRIEVSALAEPGGVSLRVRDNGDGVPDEYKQAIFGKYVQVPDDRSVRKGTGLGLTFCQLAIEAHGGRIWVEDAPGGGSDFRFWLPLGDDGAAGDGAAGDGASGASASDA
jgi:signal transduction histidine kinase